MSPVGPSSSPPSDRSNPARRSWGRMSAKQLARLCHSVGTSLHAGLDVVRVWETESQRGSALQRRRIAEVCDTASIRHRCASYIAMTWRRKVTAITSTRWTMLE